MLTKNQILILNVLYAHPEREFYVRELGRILNKEPGTFQKAIAALESDDVILCRKYGNQKLIKPNPRHPLIKEYRSIIEKTAGVPALLSGLLSPLKGISLALIFGSYAKDALKPASDIDLLVVGDLSSEGAVLAMTEKVGRQMMREINYKFYTDEEFAKRKKNDPFLKVVLKDQYLLLKGTV